MLRLLYSSFLLVLLISSPFYGKAQQAPASIPCDRLQDDPNFIEADYLPESPAVKPETLEECLATLDQVLNAYQKRFITCLSEAEIDDALHYSIGTWIRNEWGLWDATPLRFYFLKEGVLHPEDMSSIILLTYHRRLMGKPDNVGQQIEHHRNYWISQGVDIDALLDSALKNEAEINQRKGSGNE